MNSALIYYTYYEFSRTNSKYVLTVLIIIIIYCNTVIPFYYRNSDNQFRIMTAPAHSESSIPPSAAAAVVKPSEPAEEDNHSYLIEPLLADKNLGNAHFKAQNFPKALGAYHRVLMQLRSLTLTDADGDGTLKRNFWNPAFAVVEIDPQTGREITNGKGSSNDAFTSGIMNSLSSSKNQNSSSSPSVSQMKELALLGVQTLVNMATVYMKQVALSTNSVTASDSSDLNSSTSEVVYDIPTITKLSKAVSSSKKALLLITGYELEACYSKAKPALKLAQAQILLGELNEAEESLRSLSLDISVSGIEFVGAEAAKLRKQIAARRKLEEEAARGVYGKMFG